MSVHQPLDRGASGHGAREAAQPPPVVALSARQRGARLVAKRAIDVAVATVLLVLGAPLLLAIALAIRVDSPGPALFRQRRVGRRAEPFLILKFRSMHVDADERIHEDYVRSLLRDDQGAGAGMYKVERDPRVTRVGRVLRSTSLDELPQLINVLKGDMSLVGPRPDVPYAVEEYERWQWRRFEVLPGITGLWQVSGRSALAPRQMLRLDVDYVDNYSLALDLKVLCKTIPAVLRRVGSA